MFQDEQDLVHTQDLKIHSSNTGISQHHLLPNCLAPLQRSKCVRGIHLLSELC